MRQTRNLYSLPSYSYMSLGVLRFNFVLDLSECPDNLRLNSVRFTSGCQMRRFVPESSRTFHKKGLPLD